MLLALALVLLVLLLLLLLLLLRLLLLLLLLLLRLRLLLLSLRPGGLVVHDLLLRLHHVGHAIVDAPAIHEQTVPFNLQLGIHFRVVQPRSRV